jgi:hypothetical protein
MIKMSKVSSLSNITNSKVRNGVVVVSILAILVIVSSVPLFALVSQASTVSFKITPVRGDMGTSISGSGKGYLPGSTVTIVFNSTTGVATPVTTTTANSTGSISVSFVVPQVAAGAYTVVTSGGSGYSAHAKFTVVSKAKITISPKTGTAGAIVTITGSNFASNSALTIKFDNKNLTTGTSSSTGTVSLQITVPSGKCSTTSGDACPITVTDQLGYTKSAVFTAT